MHQKILDAFNRWFTSTAGVIQTFLVTVAIVAVEEVFPQLDQHGFWLLYWLTVYSAVTQPALANVGAKAAEQNAQILETLRQMSSDEVVVDAQTLNLLRRVAAHVGIADP